MWKRKEENSPTIKQWKDFLKIFKKNVALPFRISICGGETLSYPYLAELIRYTKSQGFNVSITTNAFLLDKKMAERLYIAGLREYVISLDSYDEKTHDEIRGINGSYKKVIEAIDILSNFKEKISINLLCVIMSKNIESIIPLAEWANTNPKINSINFNAITEPLNSGAGEDWYKDSGYSYLWPDYKKAEKIIDELIKMKKNGYKIGNPISQLELFKRYFKQPKLFVKDSCHMSKSISVNSEGYIFMCHYFGAIGNIKNENFSKIWQNDDSNNIRKKIVECKKNCKMLINCNFQD
jgi:MoaA/NifB/PqqE/SkfB family radical SAM enzyme